MEEFFVGTKCMFICDDGAITTSFLRAKVEWKEEYRKYLGQNAEVLSLFADTALLRMENGKEYKFPLDCITRIVDDLDAKKIDLDWQEKMTKNPVKIKLKTIESNFDGNYSDDDRSDTSTELKTDDEILEKSDIIRNPNVLKRIGDEVFGDKPNTSGHPPKDLEQKLPRSIKVDLDAPRANYTMKLEEIVTPLEEYCELKKLLQFFNLQNYYKNLVDQGFESVEDLEKVQLEDLKVLGFKLGHAKRLMRVLQEYQSSAGLGFQEINRNLQKRRSLLGHRKSLISALNLSMNKPSSGHMTNLSASCISKYGLSKPSDLPKMLSLDESQAISNSKFPDCQQSFSLGHCSSLDFGSPSKINHNRQISVWEDEGYLMLPFDKKPLGIGVMSPLSNGTMVSSVTDDKLKSKGVSVGLPLLYINDIEVASSTLNDVANILKQIKFPFTITFGLKPYFRTGQKVNVLTNNKWYPCTVVKMSKTTKKVSVKYDNSPFRFSNTETISSYNRIREPGYIEKSRGNQDASARNSEACSSDICENQNSCYLNVSKTGVKSLPNLPFNISRSPVVDKKQDCSFAEGSLSIE